MIRGRLVALAAAAVAVTGISAPQALAAPVGDLDADFVRSVHRGNLAETAAGQDARKNGTTPCVREAGEVLVRDHGKLDTDLTALAHKLGVALPGSPTAAQEQALAAVREEAGSAAYDTAWLRTQETAHTETLALIDQELENGGDPEIVAAARAARPVVAMHLDMVREGTCQEGGRAAMVDAGSGGDLAALADDSSSTAGAVGLGVGGLLAALGAAGLVRGRRSSRP